MKVLIYATILIIICLFIHALTTQICLGHFSKKDLESGKGITNSKIFHISWIILVMFIASLTEALIWAGFYVFTGAIEDFHTAAYFSLVTYTTLGYGDITLAEEWRILASSQAAIGIIIFGWSTAIVMAVVQNLYKLNKNS